MATNVTEAVNEKVGQNATLNLNEVGSGAPIEKAVEGDIATEEFMNDILTVIVAPSASDEELEVITVNCNSVNQPIIRGQEVKIKRKYVEILANSRRTDYEQKTHDANDPASIQMHPKTTLYYPFVVVHDPHKHGREWLNQVLAQPV